MSFAGGEQIAVSLAVHALAFCKRVYSGPVLSDFSDLEHDQSSTAQPTKKPRSLAGLINHFAGFGGDAGLDPEWP